LPKICRARNLCVKLSKAEQGHLWAVLPTSLSVPKFDRFDHAALAWQIDSARLTAGGNAIANEKFFVRAVMKVHDYLLEENFTAFDAQLDGAEAAIMLADVDIVVILGPINVGVAEIIPALRLSSDGSQSESDEQCE
jgi:hypothetical protein